MAGFARIQPKPVFFSGSANERRLASFASWEGDDLPYPAGSVAGPQCARGAGC